MKTKEQILGMATAHPTPIEMPEWGGTFFIRQASAAEVERWAETVDERCARAAMAALAVCDADGVRLFADEDVEALSNQPFAVLNRIWQVAAPLNGIASGNA